MVSGIAALLPLMVLVFMGILFFHLFNWLRAVRVDAGMSLRDVHVTDSAQVKGGLFGARKGRRFPFDGVVDDAAHGTKPKRGLALEDLLTARAPAMAEGSAEAEAELLAGLEVGFWTLGPRDISEGPGLGRGIDCVVHMFYFCFSTAPFSQRG